MSYEITDFQNIVIKSFFKNESENVTNVKNENIDRVNEKIPENENIEKKFQSQNENEEAFFPNSFQAPEIPIKRDRNRPRKLSLRYKNFETNISIFFQNDFQNDQQNSTPGPFVKSRKKKINELFEKNCFEIVSTSDVFHEVRIFNSRFVDEIKNINTIDAYEKFRLVMQIYNDDDKTKMLIQTPTIQRMSQRFILTLIVNMSHLSFFLRDISQVYVQSTISLTRRFFIRSSIELEFRENTILKIIKSFYGISEAETHWFNTYHKHHTEKLAMQQFTYDSCLLYTNLSKGNKDFEIVELQIDDTLILKNQTFANVENFHFHETKLLAKKKRNSPHSTR